MRAISRTDRTLFIADIASIHRRIREKYEAELKEVERSERSTLEKFNTMKVK